MVTWTFDLITLCVGMLIGFLIAGFVLCFTEMRDRSWSDGFSSGYGAKKFVEKLEEQKKKEE